MKSQSERQSENTSRVTTSDLEMEFPQPDKPLLEGPGEPCTWAECMRETAAMTNYWLKHFGDEPMPYAWEERFTFELES